MSITAQFACCQCGGPRGGGGGYLKFFTGEYDAVAQERLMYGEDILLSDLKLDDDFSIHFYFRTGQSSVRRIFSFDESSPRRLLQTNDYIVGLSMEHGRIKLRLGNYYLKSEEVISLKEYHIIQIIYDKPIDQNSLPNQIKLYVDKTDLEMRFYNTDWQGSGKPIEDREMVLENYDFSTMHLGNNEIKDGLDTELGLNLGDFLYAPRKFDINERNALYEWSYEKVKEDKTHWLEIIIPVIPLGAGIIIYILSFAYSKFKGFDVCNAREIMALAVTVFDFYTDCRFTIYLFSQKSQLAYYCLIFIAAPWLVNFFLILNWVKRFHHPKKYQVLLNDWIEEYRLFLVFTSLLLATNFDAIGIFWSKMIPTMMLFRMPVTPEAETFLRARSYVGLVLENIPQILIQTYYATTDLNFDDTLGLIVVGLALVASSLNVVIRGSVWYLNNTSKSLFPYVVQFTVRHCDGHIHRRHLKVDKVRMDIINEYQDFLGSHQMLYLKYFDLGVPGAGMYRGELWLESAPILAKMKYVLGQVFNTESRMVSANLVTEVEIEDELRDLLRKAGLDMDAIHMMINGLYDNDPVLKKQANSPMSTVHRFWPKASMSNLFSLPQSTSSSTLPREVSSGTLLSPSSAISGHQIVIGTPPRTMKRLPSKYNSVRKQSRRTAENFFEFCQKDDIGLEYWKQISYMVDGTLTDMFLEEVFHFIGRKDKPFNVDDLTEFFLTTWEEEVEEFKDNLIIFSNSTANSRTPFSSGEDGSGSIIAGEIEMEGIQSDRDRGLSWQIPLQAPVTDIEVTPSQPIASEDVSPSMFYDEDLDISGAAIPEGFGDTILESTNSERNSEKML